MHPKAKTVATLFPLAVLLSCAPAPDVLDAVPEQFFGPEPPNERWLAEDWLQWGGPTGDFMVEAEGLGDRWPEAGPRQLWKRELGEGYSSILVKNDRLFTMYRAGESEVVVALNAKTGETIWEHRYARNAWAEMIPEHGLGPNATPLIVGNRIVSVSIDGQLRSLALDTGELRWKHDLPAEFGRRERDEEYGYSASPLAYGGSVIVQVGGDDHAVIAFDSEDGSIVWNSEPGGVSYAQATITRLAGRNQFIYFSPEGVNALDPSTGQILWRHEVPVHNGNHLTPVVKCDDHHIWVSSQFVDAGGRLLRISDRKGYMEVKELVYNRRLRASHWTMIPLGDVIYGSTGGNEVSFLTAFNWKTGKTLWRERGYHKAQALYADGKLIFLDEDGQLVLGKISSRGFERLALAQVTDSISWTVPTLVGSMLYLRDTKHILALDLSRGGD